MFVQHQRSIESLAVFALETFNQPCLALCNQFNNLLVGKMFVALVTEDGKCAVHVGTFRYNKERKLKSLYHRFLSFFLYPNGTNTRQNRVKYAPCLASHLRFVK